VPCPGPDGPHALDVTDGEAVLRRIREAQPNGIIHLAGVSSVAWSHVNPAKTFFVNTLGAVNLLQAVREIVPATRLLLIGSGEMYGRVPEERRACEEDELNPLSPYAASKCAAEEAARQYAGSYGVQVVCARPFNHLGTGQAPQFVVPSFARQIADVKRGRRAALIEVGDLTPVRDFLHVDDVIRGYRLLLERGDPGKAYNLCSGEPLSVRSLLEELLEVAGVQLEIRVDSTRLRPVEIPWLVGDASRIRALGWHPLRTVHEALAEAFNEALGG
jgi:GDP-4-dehydro-6-deoxy-D-mannose reductase